VAFLGFGLLHAGWAFAAPYDGPPDEQMHALRAAGIMQGEVIAPDSRIQTVPSSLDKNNVQRPNGSWQHQVCFPMQVNVPADCAEGPGGDQTLVGRYVTEARFNPVYYAFTGWPLKFWPEWKGIILARLLTSAAMAALLACAVVAGSRWTRHRSLVAGIVVAVTPMTAHLAGSINPNGVEIAAGVALFAALIAVVHEQREGVNRAAVALAGVSASILVTPRFSGVMWLMIILGVILVPSSWARLKVLMRSRTVQVWSAVVILATIASVAWTMAMGTAALGSGNNGWTTNQLLRFALIDMWPNVTNQMIGVMGWAETLMPRLIYVVWFMAAGLLLLGGLALGNLVDRWRLVALFFGTFTPLLGMELLLVNDVGWFNQGRYFLPGAVGLPMLAALIMARRGIAAEQMRSITRLLAFLLLPIHVVCLAYTMTRWQSGLAILNPFKGSWTPPYGTVVPLALGLVGAVVLFIAYWQASSITPVPAAVTEQADEEPAAAAPKPETVSV